MAPAVAKTRKVTKQSQKIAEKEAKPISKTEAPEKIGKKEAPQKIAKKEALQKMAKKEAPEKIAKNGAPVKTDKKEALESPVKTPKKRNLEKLAEKEVEEIAKTQPLEKIAKQEDEPKKPAGGGYGIFLAENREEIKNSLPAGQNKVTDVAKLAASRWREMSEEDKAQYQKKYQEKKDAYDVSMKEYKESHPEGSSAGKRSKKEAKSKELGPMELAEQARKRRALHQRAQRQGLLDKLFALSKELQGVSVSDHKILTMLEKSAGMVDVARRKLLGEL
eukprot:TRINITY_DN76236_c0_g1_i1.p1 TRINITY_DN76236_c0_g1~~TRINITY_DN76236_c0_g1_i1.p1  ORF type:complete len:277 (+),score=99.72 TRINITY_DN76236_c0_g1_i1:68-898(+)